MEEKKKRKRIPYIPKPKIQEIKKDIPFVRPDEKEIRKILNDLLCEEARPEGNLILSKASDGQVKEFMTYYNEDKENICCMVLDSIKIKLVESGEMQMGTDDWFGKPMF